MAPITTGSTDAVREKGRVAWSQTPSSVRFGSTVDVPLVPISAPLHQPDFWTEFLSAPHRPSQAQFPGYRASGLGKPKNLDTGSRAKKNPPTIPL